ncbi:MAG: hypothetical protein M1830_000272 [Pleopsidium flavum]|nr:MAG: hypothetical protein M1830_000272 [Pleopsidium flavum]
MAEIGLVASVVQIADTGIKLSITLYTVAETVLKADKSIKEIASDVSLTSSVLEELGQNLKKDQKSRLCSENAVKTAEGIVKECAAIFEEINRTLETTLNKIKPPVGADKGKGRNGAPGGKKMAVAALERLKWPFLQPKMQLLRSNLDRLKSTLVLMLNVITYARKVSEDHATPSTLEDQRKLIEDLARSNQEYTTKFKELTRAIEGTSDHPEAPKGPSKMDEAASPGFLQANAVLPPSGAVDVARVASRNLKHRRINLTMQHIPPDLGKMSDELEHYCLLINHLLERIDAVQYKIKNDVRRRIRSDVVHMHEREADQLREVHGHEQFSTAMDSAISWVQAPQHVDFNTFRGVQRSATGSQGNIYAKYDNIVLADEDDVSVHPKCVAASQVEMRAQETLTQPELPVARLQKREQLIGDEGVTSLFIPRTSSVPARSRYQDDADSKESKVRNEIRYGMGKNLASSIVAEGSEALAKAKGQDVEDRKRNFVAISQKSDCLDDNSKTTKRKLNRVDLSFNRTKDRSTGEKSLSKVFSRENVKGLSLGPRDSSSYISSPVGQVHRRRGSVTEVDVNDHQDSPVFKTKPEDSMCLERREDTSQESPSTCFTVTSPVPNDEQTSKQASEPQAKVMTQLQQHQLSLDDIVECIDSDEEEVSVNRRRTKTPSDMYKQSNDRLSQAFGNPDSLDYALPQSAYSRACVAETPPAHREGTRKDEPQNRWTTEGVNHWRLGEKDEREEAAADVLVEYGDEEAAADDLVDYSDEEAAADDLVDYSDEEAVGSRRMASTPDRIEDLNIVDDLIAQWTTLPSFTA